MAARLVLRALASLRDLLAAQVKGWLASARFALAAGWAIRPAPPRAGAVLLVLGLLAAGAAAVQAQARRAARLPSPLDWRAAEALLRRDARPGDAVVAAPGWLERVRQVTPAGIPVVASASLAGERLPGVSRAWLLSATGVAHQGWEAEAELGRRAGRTDAQQLGGLEAARFDLAAPVVPLATLADRPPPPARAALREAGGQPRRCLLVQPVPGEALALSFPGIRLGRALAGHAALLEGPGDAPVRLAFQVDGEEVGAVEVRRADGWLPFSLDTSRSAFGAHEVALLVSAAGEAARPVCLEALALP